MAPKLVCLHRRGGHSRLHLEEESPADPDNVPARSRLFLVVPKTAEGAAIEVTEQRDNWVLHASLMQAWLHR